MRKVSPSYGNRGYGVEEMRSRAHVVAAAYARALELAGNPAERAFLRRRIDELNGR